MSGEALPVLPQFLIDKGFALIERVGSGGFATVYKASWTRKPGEDIAAKVITLNEADQVWVMKNLKNEMKILRRLNHPNVTRVYELAKTKTSAFIFMEFAKNGSIFDLLQRIKKPITEQKVKKYMKDIFNGLAYCHGQGVAHRDIKPDNFLIDHNEKVMLSDFGFACISITRTDAKLMKGTGCGTEEYKAIEIKMKKEGEVYDAKATDLYSMGISLYSMVYFDLPFDPRNLIEMISKQKTKEYRHKIQSQNTSEHLRDLIDKLLDPNPTTRITSAAALKHKWLTT